MMPDPSSQEDKSAISVDLHVADAQPGAVYDADAVIDGVAGDSRPALQARLAVTAAGANPVFDAGTDPSTTTDLQHDDSPMLPERHDNADHHS